MASAAAAAGIVAVGIAAAVVVVAVSETGIQGGAKEASAVEPEDL